MVMGFDLFVLVSDVRALICCRNDRVLCGCLFFFFSSFFFFNLIFLVLVFFNIKLWIFIMWKTRFIG